MFTTVISSYGALDDEFLMHQVLGNVIKSGLQMNVSVANSLISVFGGFDCVEVASYVFNNIDEHDTISWNSLLAAFAHNGLYEESVEYFHLMRINRGKVDVSTLSTVLSICDSVDNLNWGRGIHGLLFKMGFELDICICNTLLTMYFQLRRYKDAEKLFRRMSQKDLITWNSMMAGYVSGGKCLDALKVFSELLRLGNKTNFVTFASALSACANAEFMSEGRIVHALAITSGLHEKTVVGNALVTMYGKFGMTQEAKKIFQNMSGKELVTWNALIGGYAENEEVNDAIKTFKLMRESGISSNYITLTNVLRSCRDSSNLLPYGMPLHAHILSIGFGTDEYVSQLW